MKRLMQKLEDIMVAITFEKAGEFDAAEQLTGAKPAGQSESMAEVAQVQEKAATQ